LGRKPRTGISPMIVVQYYIAYIELAILMPQLASSIPFDDYTS